MDEFLALESRAEMAPEAAAILAPGRQQLTYAGLWRRIVEIRRELIQAGLVTGQPVAVVGADGPEFLITLLATFGLGPSAPIDCSGSRGEFEAKFAHLRAPALVTFDGCSPAAVDAAAGQGMRVVRLGYHPGYELASVECTRGTPCAPARLLSGSLLLFTSSTTGRAKLVPLTVANLEFSCGNEARLLELGARDRSLSMTPLSNLRGIRAALTQLSQGGSIVCAPAFDPSRVREWIDEFRPTWISIAAPALGVLLSLTRDRAGWWRSSGVRFVRIGGTPPQPQVLREFEELSGMPVLDGYGTSETTGVTRATPSARRMGSVGRSTGATIAILDEAGNPLAPGVTGEIAIRGPNVTSGYIDDDEANRRAFAGGWFHTRDLGYLDEDGFLFLTGRMDDVIHRGGQKIHPQEVEAVLGQHPGVRDSAVFAVAHPTLGEEVAAAVVVDDETVTELELRQFVAARLSAYKVPRQISFVARVPRSEAGKVKRRRLAVENLPLAAMPAAGLWTEAEREIAAIWEEQLHSGPIDREADFSRLGGDSLTAALIAVRLEAAWGVKLDLRLFTERPALKDFAAVVEEVRQGRREHLQPIEPAPRGKPFPLSFAQERIWKYSFPADAADTVGSLGYNVAFAHLLEGRLDVEVLRRSMEHLVARHEILRTTFERTPAGPVQTVHASGICDLRVLDFSGVADRERQAGFVLQQESARPFDLARGPLVRFVLIRFAERTHWLLRVNHHIISDGHSWKVYFRELGCLYQRQRRGEAPGAEPPRPDYADFALWQRRHESQESCRRSTAWWAEQFSKESRIARAPLHESVNRAFCSAGGATGGLHRWGLDTAVSERLRQLQRTDGVSFFECRLAAFAALLADVTGESELVIGAHVSLRNRVEWHNVFGDFTNLVTLVLRVDDTLSFRAWMRVIHERVTASQTYADVPYEVLREELQERGVKPPDVNVIFEAAEHTAPGEWGEVSMTWLHRVSPVMPWGLSVFMDKYSEDRSCLVMFDAGLYAPGAIAGLSNRLARLLDAASLQPERTLRELVRVTG